MTPDIDSPDDDPAPTAGVAEVELIVAHSERATLRVGDVFLKIDADQSRTDREVEAMALAPVPTPKAPESPESLPECNRMSTIRTTARIT